MKLTGKERKNFLFGDLLNHNEGRLNKSVLCREIQKKIAVENLELAQQHKSHQEYLNRVLYKTKPTAAFFEQFNRDAR